MTYKEKLEKEFRAILATGDAELIVGWFNDKQELAFQNGIRYAKRPKDAQKSSA